MRPSRTNISGLKLLIYADTEAAAVARRPPSSKRKGMADYSKWQAVAAAARRPPSPKRKGTTDYSKWALIDDEEDEDDALSPAPGL